MMTSGDGRLGMHGAAHLALPRPGVNFVAISIILILIPTTALAAQESPPESAIAWFIAELGILLLVGRIMGEAPFRSTTIAIEMPGTGRETRHGQDWQIRSPRRIFLPCWLKAAK